MSTLRAIHPNYYSSYIVVWPQYHNWIQEKKPRQVRIHTRYEFVLIVGHFYLTIQHFNYVPNAIVI